MARKKFAETGGYFHVFDVDGPLYEGHSGPEFEAYLAEKGLFDKTVSDKKQKNLRLVNEKKMTYAQEAGQGVLLTGEGLKGQNTLRIAEEAENFVRLHKDQYNVQALGTLRQLNSRGMGVALVSLAPRVLISALGKVNGVKIDYLYGADYASKGNRYTGETITKDIIEFKRDAILKIAKMFGIPKSKMVFYGDSVTDYTSARMARVRFVPMNPSESLKEEWESFNRTRKSLAIPAKSRAKKAAARTKKRVK